jgi:hypothetical protein
LKSRAKITWSLRDQENYIGCALIVPALKSQAKLTWSLLRPGERLLHLFDLCKRFFAVLGLETQAPCAGGIYFLKASSLPTIQATDRLKSVPPLFSDIERICLCRIATL